MRIETINPLKHEKHDLNGTLRPPQPLPESSQVRLWHCTNTQVHWRVHARLARVAVCLTVLAINIHSRCKHAQYSSTTTVRQYTYMRNGESLRSYTLVKNSFVISSPVKQSSVMLPYAIPPTASNAVRRNTCPCTHTQIVGARTHPEDITRVSAAYRVRASKHAQAKAVTTLLMCIKKRFVAMTGRVIVFHAFCTFTIYKRCVP